MITLERSRFLFTYNSENGVLVWKNKPSKKASRIHIGSEVGSVWENKYLRFSVDGKFYYVHRIIWLFVTGSAPTGEIDHIDGNGFNNRMENLRDVPGRLNRMNQSINSRNTSGVMGVSWDKNTSKWRVQIGCKGKVIHYGSFSSLTDAKQKRLEVEVLHGFHGNHGKRPST